MPLISTLPAAVAGIPITGAVVVVVIAPLVAREIRCATLTATVLCNLVSRILALAQDAVRILVLVITDTTAIASIPFAAAVVVIVIAVAVFDPGG